MPMEVDYGVESQLFRFATAYWILQMFPCGRTKFESENKIDVVIERKYSELSKHPVVYKICLETYDEKFEKTEYPLKSFGKGLDTTGSYIFVPNYPIENVCNITSYNDFCSLLATNESCDAAVLICDIRIKLDSQTISDQSSTGKRNFIYFAYFKKRSCVVLEYGL